MQSPPLIKRLREMMNNSDNVMAESIGREVAAAQRDPQSFEGAVRAVLGQLNSAKIDTGGSHLMDCSGLSVDDRLTAETLDETVNAATGNDQPRLRPLVDLCPSPEAAARCPTASWTTTPGASSSGLAARQDRVVDWHQFVRGDRHRCQRAGADVRTDLQQRGPTGRTAIDALAATLRSCGCST